MRTQNMKKYFSDLNENVENFTFDSSYLKNAESICFRHGTILIPTNVRPTNSIIEQIRSFDRSINEKEENNTMEISDSRETNLPWNNVDECAEFLKEIFEKKFDGKRRREMLIEVQWLTNESSKLREELFEAMIRRCRSSDVKKFVQQLNEESNSSLFLLGILFGKLSLKTIESKKLIESLHFYETQRRKMFSLKLKELKRLSDGKRRNWLEEEISKISFRDDFGKFLSENENRLNESTIGTILDELEKLDFQSKSSTMRSNEFLFSRQTRPSRILLKKFLHSSSWSTIVECLNELFNNESIEIDRDQRDSIVILDTLQAFLQLSSLCSGREFKMLERCQDDFLIDFHEKQFRSLIFYVLDEADRRSLNDENLFQHFQRRYQTIFHYFLRIPSKRIELSVALEKFVVQTKISTKFHELLKKFSFLLYLNEKNLFDDRRTFVFVPNFRFVNLQIDAVLHDFIVRFNNFETISTENFSQICRLLKIFASRDPILLVRHLKMLKDFLQSRSSTLNIEQFQRRNCKRRQYFISLFDLIQRLRPLIYEEIYRDDLQTIFEIFFRFIFLHFNGRTTNLSTEFLDQFFVVLHDYFVSTLNWKFLNIFFLKFFDKLQSNKEFRENQFVQRLSQLQIFHQTVKNEENSLFDIRLKLSVRNSNVRTFDFQFYRRKFSSAIEDNFSSSSIDEISFLINELKKKIDEVFNVEQMSNFIEIFADYLFNGPRKLIEEIYDFILKFLEKNPQDSSIFYSTYVKCLLSKKSLVFQMAVERFSQLIIFFQNESNQLFSILIQQALINQVDVTSAITPAIRFLNLNRYDSIHFNSTINNEN